MLFVLFQLGKDRYALAAREIAEVLPLVNIKQIPHAPPGVAGAFNYGGTSVPVIDLSELMLGRPAEKRLRTHIILVRYSDEYVEKRLLGLIAEKSTETLRRDPADFVPSGIMIDQAPYLGPVTTYQNGLVQWVGVNELLPPSVRDLLFKERSV